MNAKEYKKPTINLSRFRWVYLIIALVFLYYSAQLFNYQFLKAKPMLPGLRITERPLSAFRRSVG